MCLGTVLANIQRPGRPQDAQRSSGYSAFGRPLGRKGCSKGGFWQPRGTQNGSKIALLSIGWHFDPLKMASGKGFGKNMEIRWKY